MAFRTCDKHELCVVVFDVPECPICVMENTLNCHNEELINELDRLKETLRLAQQPPDRPVIPK